MTALASSVAGSASNDPDVERWSNFIENLNRTTPEVPAPFKAVDTLARKYLEPSASILDVGCETGKNAIALIRAGHKVTLLDIAPNAIRYTQENLHRLGLGEGIADSVTGKIEALDIRHGPFKAVVGTYAFSFIPPDLFEGVMRSNVLGRVEPGGYFAGGFFGPGHAWANRPRISILTLERLETLFSSMGFSICEQEEKSETQITALNGVQLFHTIEIIARRELKIES